MPAAFRIFYPPNTKPGTQKTPSFYMSLINPTLLWEEPKTLCTVPSNINAWNNELYGSLFYARESYPLTQPGVLNDGYSYNDQYRYLFSSDLLIYSQRGLSYDSRVPGSNWSPGITVNFYQAGMRSLNPLNWNFGLLMQPLVTSEPTRRLAPSGPHIPYKRELPYWLKD